MSVHQPLKNLLLLLKQAFMEILFAVTIISLATPMCFLLNRATLGRETDALRIKKFSLVQDINVAKAIQFSAAELKDEKIHLRAQLDRASELIPRSTDGEKYHHQIAALAQRAGVTQFEMAADSKQNRGDLLLEGQALKMVGRPNQIHGFIRQLQLNSPLILITSMDLVPAEGMYDLHMKCGSVLHREPSIEELKKAIQAKKRARLKLRVKTH